MNNTKCLLCGQESVTSLACELRRCRNCSFLFVAPDERARQQASFHVISDQAVDEQALRGLQKKYPKDGHGKKDLYQLYAARTFNWYGGAARVLDVGASGGFFLHEVEQLGVAKTQLRTLEVDPVYQALTEEYFGYQGDIANIEQYEPPTTFHLVTMFDVLEHVDDFWRAIKNIHGYLEPDGRLLLKLPNGNWAYLKYRLLRLLGMASKIPFYLYLTPGGHLNYWSRKSIARLEQAGYSLESFEYVKPTKRQFGVQYLVRMLAYRLDGLLGTNLFPEFIVTFKKVG